MLTDRVARGTATINTAYVAAIDRELFVAARLLGGGIVNAFGWPEIAQFTADGHIPRAYITASARQHAVQWAARRNIDVIEGVLPE